MVNEEIKSFLKENRMNYDDSVTYLLCVYYGLKPSFIPDFVKAKVHALNIISQDSCGGIKFNIPLFKGQETAFEWVKKEYIPLFKAANPDKGGNIKESTIRMKKFFAHNPEIRKDDVLKATKFYIFNTDNRYLKDPHYFIEKGVGTSKTSGLLDWIERYREYEDSTQTGTGTSLNQIIQT